MDKCRGLMKENGGAVLLTRESTVRWLTGFEGAESCALLMDGEKYFVTDSRYAEAAEKQIPGDFRVLSEKTGISAVPELIRKLGAKQVFAEIRQLSLFQAKQIEEKTGAQIVPIDDEIAAMRSVKSSAEIEKMKIGAKLTEEAFMHICRYMKPGVSEYDIYAELLYFLHKNGSEPSFTPIIAGGENSSMPHASVTNRKLREGDFLTIDMGCKTDGVCTDFTRTVAISGVVQRQQMIYNIVEEAHQAAMEAVKNGAFSKAADTAARDLITERGFGDCFGHGTGHGVGYDIHEAPTVNGRSDEVLKSGMVVTIEPGIYLPGEFGVRTEDMVLVTEDGFDDFYSLSTKLITV